MTARQEIGREQLRRIGGAVRRLRTERRLTLRRLAEISRLSVSTLQALERGDGSPALLTLLSVANGLGQSVDRLMELSLQAPPPPTVARGALPRGRETVVRNAAPRDDQRSESAALVIAPGGSLPPREAPRRRPLLAYVVEGKVELRFRDGTVEILAADDAIHLAGDAQVRWRNPGRTRSVVLALVDAEAE